MVAVNDEVIAVTVSVVLPEILPKVAEMVDEPIAMPVARPPVLIVATVVVPEDQVTKEVISHDVPSEYVPAAANWLAEPTGMELSASVTVMDCSVTAVTVSVTSPETLPEVAVMTDEPGARLVTKPSAATVATEVVPEDQVAEDVISHDVLSEYTPVALNWLVKLAGMDGLVGTTMTDCSVAAVTVSVALPETLPEVAEMADEPAFMPIARPPAETVATEVVAEDHVTENVMSFDVPSEYEPIAVNWLVWSTGIDRSADVTAIDCRVAAVTVSLVLPEMLPEVAKIMDEPAPMLVASPFTSTVAVEVVSDDQITEDVMFVDVPSEYEPIAVNWIVNPAGMDGFIGVTAMDCSVAAVTVSVVFPDALPEVAMMTDDPTATPVAIPLTATVAAEVVADDHVTDDVIFREVPSEYLPVAVNWSISPAGMDGFRGVTVIDCSVAAVTVSVVLPEMPSEVALMTDDPTLTLEARPVAETVATEVVPDDQVAEDEIFREVPSEYVPIAVNWVFNPTGIDGLAGVTAMDCKVTAAALIVALLVAVPSRLPVSVTVRETV
jgi:hypothetical protein